MDSDAKSLRESLRTRVASDPDLSRFDLVSVARLSVRLATQRVPFARIELGDSRIGGMPDVPPCFEWPRWFPPEERSNKFGDAWYPSAPAPLGFIAQIDLSSISYVDDVLPKRGWLYFFYDRYCEPWGYDPADRGCCRVIYADCERSELVRTEAPSDKEPEHVAAPCLLEAWPELTLPEDFPHVQYGTPAFKAYHALCQELTKGGGYKHHRLLGNPQIVQNPMELECQLVSNGIYYGDPSGYQSVRAEALKAGASDWRLLLQIDTDEDGPGWMWGDVGRIYFWIKKQDLAALRFDDVWLIFQCC